MHILETTTEERLQALNFGIVTSHRSARLEEMAVDREALGLPVAE